MRFFCLYFLISISFILTGCNKMLNQQPLSELPYDQFWQTANDAKFGNAAIYSGLQKTFSSSFIEWGDARSDNLKAAGTGDAQVSIAYNGLTALTLSADWTNLYSTIARANLAIKYVPNIKDALLTNTLRNNYLAQAYASRAFLYFWAVRLWGDVPVRLTPYETLDSVPTLCRSNKDSVLNNVIIPDLKKALKLSDKNSLSTFEINQAAILSMLTEVYLWQHDYTNVINTTDQLIALKRYDLASQGNYRNVFSDGNTIENIWSLNWNYLTDGYNNIAAKLGSTSNTSNFQIDVPFTIWESAASLGDLRRSLNYDTTLVSSGITVIWKFYPLDPTSGKPLVPNRIQNQVKLPFYRWADILLMRAEAFNWALNDKAYAISLVNRIRTRANAKLLTASNYSTQLDLEWAILTERQLELFAEGKRWFDLVRTNRVLDILDPIITNRQILGHVTVTGFKDPRKILWPISRTVLNADLTLTQNPPYSK